MVGVERASSLAHPQTCRRTASQNLHVLGDLAHLLLSDT